MIDRDEFKAALGAPDAGFNRAVDAALRQIREREERPVMKKKLSIGLLAAIIAILTLTGAALAVGLNLFDLFGRNDERLARIAPEAELATETPGEVETEEIGKSAVEIVNAYYDGESLIVAYTVDSAETFEPFTPTAEEIEKMERDDDSYEPYELGPVAPAKQAFIDAFHAGEPCGYVEYSVFPSDYMYAGKDGEIVLVPRVGDEMTLEDGRKAWLIEFAMPLPEGARNQDELEVHLPVLRFEHRQWFDGKHVYFLNGPLDSEAETYEWIDGNTYTSYHRPPEQIGEAVATVKRSNAETRRYASEDSYNGVPLKAEAQASPIHISLDIAAQGEAFPNPYPLDWQDGMDEPPFYQVVLTDEAGSIFKIDWESIETDAVRLDFIGNGHIPERLQLYIAYGYDGDWDDARILAEVEPIVLTAAD